MLKCHHSYTHLSTEKRLEDAMLAKNAAQAQLDAKQAELDKVRCATFVTYLKQLPQPLNSPSVDRLKATCDSQYRIFPIITCFPITLVFFAILKSSVLSSDG